MSGNKTAFPGPWPRGTLTGVSPVARGVLHALELAPEDLHKWCPPIDLGAARSEASRDFLGCVSSRHIARSLDRLLTYAEGTV